MAGWQFKVFALQHLSCGLLRKVLIYLTFNLMSFWPHPLLKHSRTFLSLSIWLPRVFHCVCFSGTPMAWSLMPALRNQWQSPHAHVRLGEGALASAFRGWLLVTPVLEHVPFPPCLWLSQASYFTTAVYFLHPQQMEG